MEKQKVRTNLKLNNRKASLKTLLVMLFLVLTSFASQAQWSNNPLLNTAICTATGNQNVRKVATDGAGGAIITWEDKRGGNWDLYAQRINAAGIAQWTNNGVAICTASGDEAYAVIVADGAGGAIFTWTDNRSGEDDVYAQRINAAGVVQWTANGIAISNATSEQSYPTIVANGVGGAIIVWRDYRSGIDYDIYAQRINAAGVAQWTANGSAICIGNNYQGQPDITTDGAGGAIITWEDYRSVIDFDVYTQRINAAGVVQWATNGIVICTAGGSQYAPEIVADGAGSVIITWTDYRSGNEDIYAQRINTAGVLQWTANGVAICTSNVDQLYPTLVADGAGGAIITWTDNRSGNLDIFAQRINTNGVVQWTVNGLAICSAVGVQTKPTIVSDGASGAIITWIDYISVSNFNISAQRTDAAGVVQWAANGLTISNSTGSKMNQAIVADGAGGAIISWADYRSGTSSDVYSQNINANGLLGSICVQPTLPTINASSTNNCGVQNTTLSVTSGSLNNATAWKWYSGSCGGTLAGTGNSIVVAPALTTTYYARGEGGCVTPGACASVTITVGGTSITPVITGNLAPCIGSSTTLSTGVYNTYLWSTGATTQAITVTANAVYKVTVTNAGGCTGSASAKVVKKARPTFTLNTVDTNLCPPVTSVVLSLIGNAASYTWSPATGLNQTTGTSVIASPTVTTSYYVTATGTNGCTLSGYANVNIKPKPLLLNTTSVTASSATLNWTKVDCATGYTIQYRLLGGTWSKVQVTTNISTKLLTGLQASSNYQWRIKSKYANGTTSSNTNVVSFTTPASRLGETVTVNALQVYPNPATDKLTLEFPFTEGDATITIVNALGQTLLNQKASNTEGVLEINIESLIEGIYIVDVKNGDNVFSSRFVKK